MGALYEKSVRGAQTRAERRSAMKEATCLCGWQVRGTEDEVVAQVQAHGRDVHGIESTREEVLALAVNVPAAQARADGRGA